MDVLDILKRAADKCGVSRTRFIEKDIPASMSNVVVFPFFGDLRSLPVLSMLLLKRYREEAKGSKYFIFCSYPGYEELFPFVNEYWSLNTETARTLLRATNSFHNTSKTAVALQRNLNYFFEDVADVEDIETYYQLGFKQEFMDRFKHIKCFKPTLPSAAILGSEFNRQMDKPGDKVFISPTNFIYAWHNGRIQPVPVAPDFWLSLAEVLLAAEFVPVVYQNYFTFDISPRLGNKCIYLSSPNIMNALVAMRAAGCVLDIFNGLSRLALIARCPFLVVDHNVKYNGAKEYEIDYLCGDNLRREYIFSFPTIINGGPRAWQTWFEFILNKLDLMYATFDRNALPSTSEVDEIVPYRKVKIHKAKRMGTRFIKVPKQE